MKHKLILLASASIAIFSVGIMTQARAQSADAAAPAGELQEVVVSASRIDRAGFSAPTPTTVVSAAMLEQRATVNIGDALNEIPSFRGTTTPSAGGIGNTGAVLADLRGLTPARTLVLLDRGRLPSTNIPGTGNVAGTTDLSIIPTALIRSVDIVTGGASAAYGSDAIAGVVNIVLNDKLQGIKGTLQYGQTRYSDAKDRFASLAGGSDIADGKGHVIAGLEYNHDGGTGYFNDQRAWGRAAYSSINFTTRPAGVPANVIAPNSGTWFGGATTGGLIRTTGPLFGLAFVKTASGAVTTVPFSGGQYGNFNTQLDDFTNAALAANAAAGIDNRNYQQLRPETDRFNFLGKLNYDFSDHVTGYVEPLISHTRTSVIGIARRDGAGTGGTLTILPSNPYLQQALTATQLAQVPAAGLALGYIGNDFGPTYSDISKDTVSVLVGLKGHFAQTWSWDLSYQNSRNTADRAVNNTMNNANFKNAIDAVTVAGQVVCRSTAAQAAGCQPLNILGKASGSAAALSYIFGTATGTSTEHLTEISANLQGEPFSLPAGPVSVGVGLERRSESLQTDTDAISQAAGWLSGAGASLPYVTQSVTEGYLETIMPLLKDKLLAKSLDFNGAVRLTNYSSSGNVTTWKGGVTWEPTPDFRFRGTRSRDIRAPNLVELYTPISPSLPLPQDPRPGVPAITNSAGVTTGGNPNLKPEKADTTTLGVVFQPTFLSRLNLSVDYYRISIKGAITSTTPANVIANCLPGGVYNGGPFCSLITFANNDVVHGQITSVQGTTANVAEFRTHGVDIQLTYQQPLDEISTRMAGSLAVNLQGTRVFEYWTSTDISALYPNGINRAGQNGSGFAGPAGLPSWLWTASFNYKLRALAVNAQVRYISSGHQNNGFIGPDDPSYSPTLVNSVNTNTIPAVTYFNLGASYNFGKGDRREVYFSIDNLLDKDPPQPANNNAYYDLMGRTYKVGVRFSFD